MRILNLYQIIDNRQHCCVDSPQAAINDVNLTRQLEQLVNQKDSKQMIAQYPDDFDLYHIGYMDEETGAIKGLEPPAHIRRLSSLVQPK